MAKKKKVDEIKPINVKPLIKLIAKEKDLDPEIIKVAIEAAILSAATKRAQAFLDPRPDVDLETGDLRLYVKKKVVITVSDPRQEIDILTAKGKNPANMLGDEIEVEIDPEEFGRIAAQSVRQGILQRLRDAERDHIYNEYKDRVGSVVTGIVQRYERRDAIVGLGKVECLLPHHEIPMGVRYRFGDRIRCLIVDVRRTPKGPQVILSRTRSELVKQLFATEVPEISDGTVRIVEIAREPGVRTKIAVSSMNPDVDPVGACVGMKGSRVQMVVRELENEKIDIVPWSPDPKTYVANALNPAKIVSIEIDESSKQAHVTVAQGNLAIAIGRKGQNTKLAARLTGYRLDIRSENEEELAYEEIQRRYLEDFLGQIPGMSDLGVQGLLRSNYNSVEKIANLEPQRLLAFTADDLGLAERLVSGAQEYLEALRQMEEERRQAREAEKTGKTEGAEEKSEGDGAQEASEEGGEAEQPVEVESAQEES